jgi:hypothetical protein
VAKLAQRTALAEGVLTRNIAVNAIAAPKSRRLNMLEGMTLSAVLQGLPTFAAAVLVLKFVGTSEIVGQTGGAAIFVVLTMVFYALTVPFLGPKFPRFFRKSYEPIFFDATLSLGEKLSQWRAQPRTSVQLVTTLIMLSLLAVAVASVR